MAIQVVGTRNALVDAYTALAGFGAVYTTAPSSSAGTEPSGGSPAYARKALTWPAGSGSASSASATFDIGAGNTIVGSGLHSLVTGGTYRDGASVTSQNFATQGTYTVTFTYTQT